MLNPCSLLEPLMVPKCKNWKKKAFLFASFIFCWDLCSGFGIIVGLLRDLEVVKEGIASRGRRDSRRNQRDNYHCEVGELCAASC